jgi:hypothetical protein
MGRDNFNVLSNRRVIDMSKNIALLEPSATPLTVLLKNIASETAYNPKFEWLEYAPAPVSDAVNNGAGYADNATSIVVDNGAYFSVNDIVKVPRTGEVMRVTAVSTNTLTVTRAYGETTAAALVDNDPLLIIGNASAEGASARDYKNNDATNAYNFTEIFKTTVELSGTLDASQLYGGKDRNFQRKVKGIEHMLQIERSFLFGERKEDTTNKIRTTRGLLGFLTENIVDAGGTLTEAEFESFCEAVFRYGSNKKLLLASPKVISVINQFASGKLQMVPTDKTYGIAVTKYLSAHGELMLVKHNLLEGTVYGGYAIAIDPENVKYRYLQGRDTTLRTDIQAPDVDGFKDEYLTEAGLQLMLPKTHGVLKGVTA